MLKLFRAWLDDNDRELKRLGKTVAEINALEPKMAGLSDEQLRAKTGEFRQRLENGESLDDLLPEAFAVVREVARRTLDMRHFDVQLMGGMVLHEGNIAEMKTGEGKTLVATLPVYLNALPGRGVHVVTVNDYLARRDAEWMGAIYRFLGLSVGLIVHGLDYSRRREAYAADVTYGTNNEFGFDYLRDNMAIDIGQVVQRELNYAIVDEVDCILIDEARTPLIISGPAERSSDLYAKFARIVPQLRNGVDYAADEKAHTVTPTEEGIARVEKWLGIKNLYDHENMDLTHYLNQALKAHVLMKKDRDYIVKDGKVIIVDEFTGRLMFGRRYSDGLHQAIEAKERVRVETENQTLATITFQNYFRMYRKLAGMTGTAATEAEEFRKIYGLDVVVIPTNEPMIRVDNPDVVYKTERAKFRAVVEDIVERHKRGQPVLVGTISIEKSEELSRMLQKRGIQHHVLNAKHHEKEAEIVAKAGQRLAVTIATNMAGRGTDIVLGEGVAELGGLHVIGTERHESRRIDNQLRGRSGRQGDPGSSRFYVSLEDDLMRLFGSDLIASIMDKLGMEEDMPIEHSLVTRAIENAQKKVEARNFDLRKHVLEYDDVMNQQREIIYTQRRKVLEGADLKQNILEMVEGVVGRALDMYAPEKTLPDEWDIDGLLEYAERHFLPSRLPVGQLRELSRKELRQKLLGAALKAYEEKEKALGSELMRQFERLVTLQVVDRRWMQHLDAMDDLREGIGLRAYAQRDPLLEYKFEAYSMFQDMTHAIQEDIVRYVYKLAVVRQPERRQAFENRPAAAAPRASRKVGRNEPCPCGSGKKYKKCCAPRAAAGS